MAVAACILALLLVRRVNGGYVRQLADSLRTGQLELRADQALDLTTARTIAERHVAVDRESLLAQVREDLDWFRRLPVSGEKPTKKQKREFGEILKELAPDLYRQVYECTIDQD